MYEWFMFNVCAYCVCGGKGGAGGTDNFEALSNFAGHIAETRSQHPCDMTH